MQKCARKIKSNGGKIQAAPAPEPFGKVSEFKESIANMNDSPVIKDGDSDDTAVRGVR
jgi:hypothetical protein